MQQTTDMLAKLSTTAAHSFVPPGADGRSHPFGWLWWRSHVNAEGKAEHDRGWALAYRRARKAAGLPLTWKAAAGELIISPGRTEPALTDRINPEHDQQS
ncbi:hypothetical protein [Streptomyces sp. NPDC048650]|uniref:hypothetical protein n=1 Tax=Streptomyces sp. NPDC048650 TaxID=3365583 RepID=UPI00371BC7F3